MYLIFIFLADILSEGGIWNWLQASKKASRVNLGLLISLDAPDCLFEPFWALPKKSSLLDIGTSLSSVIELLGLTASVDFFIPVESGYYEIVVLAGHGLTR
jgi:hypothetical protein